MKIGEDVTGCNWIYLDVTGVKTYMLFKLKSCAIKNESYLSFSYSSVSHSPCHVVEMIKESSGPDQRND